MSWPRIIIVSQRVIYLFYDFPHTGNACNPRTAADWLADGCAFGNPTGTTVFDLGTHSRVTPTTSCEVTCPTDGGDFVVTSATGVLGVLCG